MHIEIKTSEFHVQNGTIKQGPRAGQPCTIRKQDGWLHTSDQPYPVRVKINLGDNVPPYQPGNYAIDESSFFVDQFAALAVGRLRLVPFQGNPAQSK